MGYSPRGHKELDTTEAIYHAQNPILIHDNYYVPDTVSSPKPMQSQSILLITPRGPC